MPQNYGALEKVLRMGEGRRLKRHAQQADYVASLEPDFERLSDAELAAKTAEFRQRLENGEALEELVFEAFAAVREAAKRSLGMRHFDVQVMGAVVLHEGDIAEMKTGEGKTLVATMPLYLNALPARGVHLVTVNDYLAKRDAEWMGPVYEALGMRASFIRNQMPFAERKEAYAADIIYGTNSEFGFDYLRDNMATSLEGTVQRSHAYAIVDEVDSILIDEARTPLIISGEPETAARTYYDFARIAKGLTGVPAKFVPKGVKKAEDDADYEFDEKFKTVSPRESAIDAVERALGIENLYDPRNAQLVNHLIQALKAESLYQRDVDYVVMDGEVKIVDEFTGRIMEGRRWSEGLHQAIEAKEGVADQRGARHARDDHAPELLPPLREARRHDGHGEDGGEGVPGDLQPLRRRDPDERPGRPRRRERLHLQDGGREVRRRHRGHQGAARAGPAGARRHDLGRGLRVPRDTARAPGHPAQRPEREAARARGGDHQGRGRAGAVTIATNMAGRGVDIKLGEGVRELGGLYVLGTERHEARRIDNQLRGRSGRQGDPASPASTSPPRTSSSASSPATGSTTSSSASSSRTTSPWRRRSSRSRSRTPRRRSRSRTSSRARTSSSTTTS